MTTPSLMIAWRLEGRRVVVVGGGPTGAERADLALQAGADVTLVAPQLTEGLQELADIELIRHIPRRLLPADLHGADLVLVAIDDAAASEAASRWARARRVPVHVSGRSDLSDFWLPATFREGPVQVAVSTSGRSPGAASRLKRQLRLALSDAVPDAVQRLGRWREGLRARVESLADRVQRADREARLPWVQAAQLGIEPRQGRLTLIGAGPGDPSLLTAGAIDALAAADLIVADRLVPAELLNRLDGEVRVARDLPGRREAGQDELYRWLEEGIEAGKQVVRLKSGDPFLFGRGREELDHFQRLGVDVDVIPGVTSAFAAPLAAGIPVTMPGLADRVTVITTRGQGGAEVHPPDFDPAGTVIWLMGVAELQALATRLIRDHGYPTNWPVAVVERASQRGQRAVRAPLHDVARVVSEAALREPAAIVLGSVVRQAPAEAFEVDAAAEAEVRVA